MIKINLYCVGSLKEDYLKAAVNEYKKRLSRYAQVEIIEIKEGKIDEANLEKSLLIEDEPLIKRLKDQDYLITMDLHGDMVNSEDFSEMLSKLFDKGISPINFAIGGTYGLSENLRNRSNKRICLSKLTFTHQMTRIILLEQIYRAFKIIKGESYHH